MEEEKKQIGGQPEAYNVMDRKSNERGLRFDNEGMEIVFKKCCSRANTTAAIL